VIRIENQIAPMQLRDSPGFGQSKTQATSGLAAGKKWIEQVVGNRR
jgi:hypothetical protein